MVPLALLCSHFLVVASRWAADAFIVPWARRA
jgi:hypothetical protein